jgi:hydroxymethylbilane synthase
MANVGAPLPLSQFLPAASQGAVGIDRLTSRKELVPFLAAINDAATFVAVNAERALLEALGGNCHSPIAALAQVEGSQIRFKGEVFTADGREMHAGEIVYEASSDGPAQLADQLLANASDELRSMFAS